MSELIQNFQAAAVEVTDILDTVTHHGKSCETKAKGEAMAKAFTAKLAEALSDETIWQMKV